jgi:putative nucleotidyltransferase with HDIG domain
MNSNPEGGFARVPRILFVDDEPLILSMIPHVITHFRGNWQIETASSGQQGLDRLANTSFDIIVSDLSMPQMNGMEFLSRARDLCPGATRIMFSSHSDRESVLDCSPLIHQFLPKPSSNELLIATLERAALVRTFLPETQMRDQVSRLEGIPSMPGVYAELMEQLQSPDTDIKDVAAIVSRDFGMTSQILRTVNSAYFGLRRPTSNISDAISHLGIETIKYLALTAGVFKEFRTRELGGLRVEPLWRHSLETARLARELANRERAGSKVAEDSFAAGLLHDLGKLVLAGSFSERYAMAGQMARSELLPWITAERNTFNCDHAEVGAYLLGLWGLPKPVVNAVRWHHFPLNDGNDTFTPLTAVHAANVLSQSGSKAPIEVARPEIDFLYIMKNSTAGSWNVWRREYGEPVEA